MDWVSQCKERKERKMPEIALFFGIRVTMYYDDHNPPHFKVAPLM